MRQKQKISPMSRACWLSCFLFHLSCQIQRLEESTAQDQAVLNEYQLTTRQLPPPRIKLLKDDTIALYLFDFSSYPRIKNKVTVEFGFKFSTQDSFYTFHENKNQPNLSYVLIYANKIATKEPVEFGFIVTANFTLKGNTKTSSQEYNTSIQVIDKFKTTKTNFLNFEEGFTFEMRSDDTDVVFPMNSDDIVGNNMNVSFQQIGDETSKSPKVSVNISPRVTIQNASYYKRTLNSNIVAALGTSLTSDVVIRQRIDKPSLFELNFMSYDILGNKNIFEAPVFIDLEFIKSMRINRYTHFITFNAEKTQAYLIIFLLKMTPKDPLPLTRLFYPDFKVVYRKIGTVMYDTSYAWRNFQEIWVFKLQKPTRVKGDPQTWEQRVAIYGILLQGQSSRVMGDFTLAGLKAQLDAKFDISKAYANITCTKIEVFSRDRGVLGCRMISVGLDKKNKILEVFVSIQIMSAQKGRYDIEVEDMMTSMNPQGRLVESVSLINFWHNEDSNTKQKHLMKPFVVVYHDEGAGYYMKSQSSEWIELMKESEMEKGLNLKDTLCNWESSTLILEFQKELEKKRKIHEEVKEITWSKSVTYFINLGSPYQGNNRVLTRVEQDVAFDKKTIQIVASTYVKELGLLAYGLTGQMSQIRNLYYRINVDKKYPRITLNTNSTENFTTNMKISLDQNSSVGQEPYTFPFKVHAQAVERFKIEPRSDKDISVLKNGKHNLEDYFKVTGPMKSIQQVSNHMGRLNFTSRSFWRQTVVNSNPKFIDLRWYGSYYFFGITEDVFFLFDGNNYSQSEVSYAQEIKALTSSCCSSNMSFYALHFNPDLENSLSVRLLDVIPDNQQQNSTILESYELKYIDSGMLSSIRVGSSKQFIKSIGEGLLAFCIYDEQLIKILILDYVDKNNPIVTPMRDITTRTLGIDAQIMKVGIVSMVTKYKSLRTLAVLIGTKSHVITEYLRYDPSTKNPDQEVSLVKIPTTHKIVTLNGSLDHISCAEDRTTTFGGLNSSLLISSKCVIILNGYLMRTLNFSATAYSYDVLDTESSVFSLGNPKLTKINEYEIPRFFKTISIKDSPNYLAVHAMDTVDHHQEFLVFQKGRKQVWTSVYASAESTASYALGRWHVGTTWMYVNEIGSELKVYLIGNMTLEVKQGYNTTGQLKMLYSTFGNPSEVDSYTQGFRFSDNLVRNNSLVLVVYGSVGGFFGLLFILGFCCCFCRCVYVGLAERFGKKEKRMIPVLVKQHY